NRRKSVKPAWWRRQAAARPATPPPTIATRSRVHAAGRGGGSSRRRWPNASEAPTSSPGGRGGGRRAQAAAIGAPRNAAKKSRRVRLAVMTANLVPAAPFALVRADEHLVVEAVHLDGDGRHVGGETEHRGERVVVEERQAGGRRGDAARRFERVQPPQREAPHAE